MMFLLINILVLVLFFLRYAYETYISSWYKEDYGPFV